jgi:molecular chaperone GrpE
MMDPVSDPRQADSHVAGPDEKTTVLPETAVALVEMERLRGELAAAEERAKNHWEQYLRALADVDNVRKRATKDLENTRQFAVENLPRTSSRSRTPWNWASQLHRRTGPPRRTWRA